MVAHPFRSHCCRASGPRLTGYGVAWLSLACAVQQAAKRSFEGLGNLTLEVNDASRPICLEVQKLVRHGLLADAERLFRLARVHGEMADNGVPNILTAQLLAEGWP